MNIREEAGMKFKDNEMKGKYKAYMQMPADKEYYKYDKLWCSYRAKSNEFVFDDTKDFIGLTNTTVIFGNNKKYNLLTLS